MGCHESSKMPIPNQKYSVRRGFCESLWPLKKPMSESESRDGDKRSKQGLETVFSRKNRNQTIRNQLVGDNTIQPAPQIDSSSLYNIHAYSCIYLSYLLNLCIHCKNLTLKTPPAFRFCAPRNIPKIYTVNTLGQFEMMISKHSVRNYFCFEMFFVSQHHS